MFSKTLSNLGAAPALVGGLQSSLRNGMNSNDPLDARQQYGPILGHRSATAGDQLWVGLPVESSGLGRQAVERLGIFRHDDYPVWHADDAQRYAGRHHLRECERFARSILSRDDRRDVATPRQS